MDRLLVLGLLLLSRGPAGDTLHKGDRPPEPKLAEVIWGWDGAESLHDYLGEPVLVEFWGMNCPNCVGGSVPGAIKLAKDYGDRGLHVLLVEVQNHKREEVVPFLLQAFPGAPAVQGVLATNAPFQLPGEALPKAALVGVDGTIVWTLDESGSVEKQIQQELARLHQPKKLDSALKPLAKDLSARNFGKAASAARAIAAKSADGSSAKASAAELVQQLEKTVAAKMAQADRLVRVGRVAKAKALLTTLGTQVAGDKELADRVAGAMSAVGSDDRGNDLEADRLLVAAEDLLRDRKGRDAAVQKLAELQAKHPDAKVVALAAELQKGLAAKDVLR